MDRREFLLGGAALLASAALLPRARAAGPGGRNLIVVLAAGGWDVTWALDPKPGVEGVDAPAGTLRRFGEAQVLVDPARPSIERYFEAWGPLTAVVNGVQVRSVAHLTCRRRILTGSASPDAPDVAAIVADSLGRERPVPYLVLGDTSFTGPLAASSGRVGTTNQLLALLDPAQDFPVEDPAARFLPSAEDEEMIARWLERRTARELKARGATSARAAYLREFDEASRRAEALRAHAGSFGMRGATLALAEQAAVAVEAIEAGVSHSVLLDSRLPWDTHTNNALQGPLHELLFEGLHGLVDTLAARPGRRAGTRLVDETVVLVLSEMSRTPRMNGTAGKDHWPVTSALVIGSGVRGGAALGGTDDRLEAVPVDLESGAPGGGARLLAENLVAGALELAGADPGAWLPGVTPLRGFHAA